MAILVRPTFFEEGNFNRPDGENKQLIHHKYIYSLQHARGKFLKHVFYSTSFGKLTTSENGYNRYAPLWHGKYYFFVSSHNIPDYNRVLNRNNCIEIDITDQEEQEVILPWPMCYHSNGAENTAQYILEEIRNNSNSEKAKTIIRMNDLESRVAEWKKLPPLQQALNAIPKNMRNEARIMWADLVKPNGIWDHKPHIEKRQDLVSNSVKRPIRENGPIRDAVFHKYNDYDIFYDVWSNIHYGYVGKVCGFYDDELLDFAGLVQIVTDIMRLSSPRVHDTSVKGIRKYDDKPDQKTIALGIALFFETNGNPQELTARKILDGIDALGKNGLLENNCVKHSCFDDNDFTQYPQN